MRLVRTLAAADRRLPFGTATVIGATALGVVLAGTSAAVIKDDGASPAVEQAAPSPSPSASAGGTPAPKPAKSEKPDEPADYILDVEAAVPGWTRISDSLAQAGPMDLEAAAEIEAGGEDPTEEDRQALRDLGFVRGHSRAWRNGRTTLVVFAYEWKNKEGPLAFVRGMKGVNEGNGGWQPKTLRSYGVCNTEDGATYDGAVTAVGKHSFLVITLRTGGCGAHEPVATIVERVSRHAVKLGA